MRIAVVTMATAEVEAVGRLSLPGRRAYCRRHGYELIVGERSLDAGRPAVWSKLLLLLEHLDRFDWLFWSDADSLILRPDVPLTDFVDPAYDLLVSHDCVPGVNSGHFLISNRLGRARAFLEMAYEQVQFVPHRLAE